MKRTTIIICLAAVMLLALAVPAFADGSSGTVYGKAVLAPYSIVVSGGGTDSNNPLTYQGNLGQWAPEQFGSEVIIQNTGTQMAEIRIAANQLPTAGGNQWGLSPFNTDGTDLAAWEFSSPYGAARVVPVTDPNYYDYSRLVNFLPSGGSAWFDSAFRFPTSTGSSADHFMSATISVVAPG
jgi:hypothetical protein